MDGRVNDGKRKGVAVAARRGLPSAKIMLRPAAALALALAVVAGPTRAWPANETGRLVDRIVAVITPADAHASRTLITLSDLELEARVALISRGAVLAAEAELPADTLAATLEWSIAEHLILAEAEQLAVAVAEPAELEAALGAFRERLGQAAFERFLERWEVEPSELLRLLRRRIVVDRYLASRLRLGGGISEQELRSAYEARKGELGAVTFAEARDSLRARMELERREELVGALVRDLRGRSQVRVLHSFGAGGKR
ncbi:MAG TPA: hypothetical protein VN033_03060 [Vulgatibacter sp.]|nr:hypothetical protein [Vulgatibacter sp.]